MLTRLGPVVSSTVIFVVTAEMFPSKVRHSLFAFVLTLGHLASSMVAVQVWEWDKYIPMPVLGVVTLVNCLLAIGLPEASNASLPKTVEDAAALGTDKANVVVAEQGAEEEA